MPQGLKPLSALALLALFCSLTPGGAPSGPQGQISDDERIRTLQEIGAEFEAVVADDTPEARARLAESLRSRAEFEAAGVAPDGSVWAQFRDGRSVVFPPAAESADETEGSTGLAHPAAGAASPSSPEYLERRDLVEGRDRAAGRPSLGGLPESRKAVVMTALGDRFGTGHTLIARWLGAKGYDVASPEPTVDELKAVRDAGVFYLRTHGGAVQTFDTERVPDEFSEWLYSLGTATPISAANDARYRDDLAAGRLTYMYAEFKTAETDEWHYAITIHFIRKYMSFSPASLVFIDGCTTFDYDVRFGFADAGASVYIGWSKVKAGDEAARYFFDRLLGANEYKKQDPPNRPFDYRSVLEAMGRAGLDVNTYAGARLAAHDRDGRFSLLVPSIRNLEIDEAKAELTLTGGFGPEEGEVEIAGTAATVRSWSEEEIRVELPPADQPGGSGDVIVRVRDHESNAVPLTLWHGTFEYQEGPYLPVIYSWLRVDLYLRADIHRRRDRPDEEAQDPPPIEVRAAPGSTAEWECDVSGTHAGMTMEGSGTGPVPRMEPEGSEYGFDFEGSLDVTQNQLVDGTFTVRVEPETVCFTRSEGFGVTLEGYIDFLMLPVLESPLDPIKMDDLYTILGENRVLLPGISETETLEWQDMPAEHPPDEETPG